MNLLGSKLYDPSISAMSKATSALLAMTALDTTNLRLTVTVPSHGILFFRMRCNVVGSTTFPQILLGVMNGATVVGRVAPLASISGTAVATTFLICDAEFSVTGLTPGSITLDAAYAVQVLVASTNIKAGGPNNNSGANAWGGFLFEIWDPQPLQTNGQVVVDANGRLDISKVAGTSQTAGDIYSKVSGLTFTGAGKVDASVRDWVGDTIPARAVTGVPIVDAKYVTGTLQTANDIGAATTPLESGTAQAGAAGTITLRSGASATDSLYNGCIIEIISGSGAGQSRVITGYVGSTKVASADQNWTTNPSSSSVYTIAQRGPALDSSQRVTVGTNADKTGYALTQSFPANFSALGITVGGHVSNVDTLTTYTGDTPQTGDAYARIGAAGAGLTALGDTRIAHLDADVSSRMATFSLPTNFSALVIDANGRIDLSKWLGQAVTVDANNVPNVSTKYVSGTLQTARDLGAQLDATISSRFAAASAPANFSALGITIGGHISTIDAYTGDTPQTGDTFVRLGAPTLSSVSADISAVKSDTGTILTDVNTGSGAIYTRLGAPAGASLAADVAAVKADTANIGTAGAGLTALGDTRIAHLNADVSTRVATSALPANFGTLGISGSGHVSNVDNLTGNTPQTGDAYARLGAPVGASISADVAGVPAGVMGATVTESYAALHATPNLKQLLCEVRALLAEKSVSGVTVSVKKLDGTTLAETFTLNDPVNPTAITRAS